MEIIFYIDETMIDLFPAADSFLLSPQKKEGKENALNLVTVQEKKHNLSIMVAGGNIVLWSL